MIPIKYLFECPIKKKVETETFITQFDYEKIKITKEGRFWKCCKKRVDLFYELELNRYYFIRDPRK